MCLLYRLFTLSVTYKAWLFPSGNLLTQFNFLELVDPSGLIPWTVSAMTTMTYRIELALMQCTVCLVLLCEQRMILYSLTQPRPEQNS